MANSSVQSFWATYTPKGSPPKITDKNIIQSLMEFRPTAYQGWWGVIVDLFRIVDWAMLRGLCFLADSVSATGTSILYFLNFYAFKPVQNFIEQFYVFIVLASLLFFGIAWIAAMSKKEIPVVDMLKSGAFSWFTFVILPILMLVGVGFTLSLSGGISTTNTPSATILKDNVWDVRAIDKANWDMKAIQELKAQGYGAPNYIEEQKDGSGNLTVTWDELGYIDPQAKLSSSGEGVPSTLSDYGQKVTSKTVVFGTTNKDGSANPHEPTLAKLSGNIFGEAGTYYTYSWNGWIIGLSLVAYIVFAVLLQLRMVRLETQVFLSWTVGSAVSLTQWGTTKRNWEILSKIGMGFTTLVFTQCLLTLFNFGLMQLNDLLSAGKINFLAYILLLIGFGMEMVDGPTLWQHLFGIDAGMQSAWRSANSGRMFLMGMLGRNLGLRNKKGKSEGEKKEKDGKKTDSNPSGPEQNPGQGTPPPDMGMPAQDNKQNSNEKQPDSKESKEQTSSQQPEAASEKEKDKDKGEGLDPKQADGKEIPINDNGTPVPETGDEKERDEKPKRKGWSFLKKPEIKKEDGKPFGDFGESKHDSQKKETEEVPKPEGHVTSPTNLKSESHLDNPFEMPKESDDFWRGLEDAAPPEPENWRGEDTYGL